MARASMAALISRIRDLTNDNLPAGSGQVWSDNQIQDVLDEGRIDVYNGHLTEKPTFSGSTIQYLDYVSEYGGWETDYVLKQYLTVAITPSFVEPIAGHFQFAVNEFPPVFITGKIYDVYRSAADILERQAAQWALRVSMTVDGQTIQRGQAVMALLNLAKTYIRKQRPRTITMKRGDFVASEANQALNLEPRSIDYYSSGSKQG